MKKASTILALTLLGALSSNFPPARAQGTAFTYLGQLQNNGSPAGGSFDLVFTLFNLSGGGAASAGPVTNSATTVSNGLFTATIDFGGAFNGSNSWLEIGVRTNGGSVFTTLSPRQPVTPAPYAITAGGITGTLAPARFPRTCRW